MGTATAGDASTATDSDAQTRQCSPLLCSSQLSGGGAVPMLPVTWWQRRSPPGPCGAAVAAKGAATVFLHSSRLGGGDGHERRRSSPDDWPRSRVAARPRPLRPRHRPLCRRTGTVRCPRWEGSVPPSAWALRPHSAMTIPGVQKPHWDPGLGLAAVHVPCRPWTWSARELSRCPRQ